MDIDLLDRAHAHVMDQIVATGAAPHYTELAAAVEVDVATGRDLVHDLAASIPGWTHPGTDHLASFPPFNLQPTQYRVSIGSEQKWYAQCGFEALAIRWLVPGSQVRVDAPCLCCGEPISVVMTSTEISSIEPDTVVGYTSSDVGGDAASRPFR